MSIALNLENIRQKIAAAATACGRDPRDIQLVAVSKLFPASAIQEAITAGHRVFGENYIQEAESKIAELGALGRFHFIGHLQSNKAKVAARLFELIETVDSLKLARALDKHRQDMPSPLDILLQVNIGQDEHKSGLAADQTEQLLREIGKLSNVTAIGLMTMPPFTDDPEDARPYFRQLRQLAEQLAAKGLFPAGRKVELSMGMSNDFPVAIEEGATIVRVGTAIFGQR